METNKRTISYPLWVYGQAIVLIGGSLGLWLILSFFFNSLWLGIATPFFVIAASYGLYTIRTASIEIMLYDTEMVIKQRDEEITVLYDEVNGLRDNAFFLTVLTDQGQFNIHKHTSEHKELYHLGEMTNREMSK